MRSTNQHVSAFGSGQDDSMAAFLRAVSLNNEAQQLEQAGRRAEALPLFQESCALKARVHGEKSVHYCISFSGLCDCLLNLGRLEEALANTQRYVAIAKEINSNEQLRIAMEILHDVERAMVCQQRASVWVVIDCSICFRVRL